ncbi:MAG: HNH endonuclease family protein [Cyanobacteria bacterium P01_G01_bin.67]
MIPEFLLTIEHILTQNLKPSSHWLDWFSQEEAVGYRHQLSNLVLLSRQKNSYASNYNFQLKKDKYFNTPICIFALTVQVLKEPEWTPKILEVRQKYLLRELKQVWQLNV